MLNNILGMIVRSNPQFKSAYEQVMRMYKETGGKLTNQQVSSIMQQYKIDESKLNDIKRTMNSFGINV